LHTLKIEKKSIITTISETIYKNSDLSDVHIIIPRTIDGMEISETNVIMEYVLPIDKSSNYAILKLNDKNYRDRWLEYTIRPTDGIVISSQPGEVLFRLLINNKKIENGKINITPVAMEETISDVTSEELLSITPTSTATASLMSFDQSSVITFDNYNDYNDYDYYTICDDGRYPVYREYMDDFDYSIIEGRDIRLTPYQLNISQEENSQYISFRMNRYEDGIDRLDKKIEIRYINPDNYRDSDTPKNLSYNNFYITFGWLISKNVTAVPGSIKFWIQVDGVNEKNENYVWKTKVNSDMNVLPCLDGDGIIEPAEADWYANIVRVENAKIQEVNDVIEQAVDSITRSITATTQALSVVEIANASATAADNSANAANSAADRVENVIADANDAIITANNSAEAANIAANSVEKAIDSANAGATIAYSAAEEARNEAVNASTATRNAISATESANIAAGAATKAADSLQVAVDAAEQAQISQAAAEAVRDYMLKEKDSFTGYDKRQTNINFANAIIGTTTGNGSVSVSDAWSAPVVNIAVDGKGVQETTTGAQLFDANKIPTYAGSEATVTNNGDGSFTVSGTGTISTSYLLQYALTHEESVKLFPAGTYKLDLQSVSTRPYFIFKYTISSGSYELSNSYSNNPTEVVITDEMVEDSAYKITMAFYFASGSTVVPGTIKPFIYKKISSTVLPWEPYTGGMSSPNPDYPQEVQSVGDGEVMEVVSSVGGRNLIKGSAFENLSDWSTNKTYESNISKNVINGLNAVEWDLSGNAPSSSSYADIGYLIIYGKELLLNIPYTISFWMNVRVAGNTAPFTWYITNIVGTSNDNNWTPVKTATNGWVQVSKTITFTSKQNNTGTRIYFRCFDGSAVSISQPKFEVGSTATPWTPAPEDVTEKNQAEYLPYLSKAQVPAVLRGIDDVRDKLECRDGVWGIERNVGIVDNGGWVLSNVISGTSGHRFSYLANDIKLVANVHVYCSKYLQNKVASYNVEGDYISTSEVVSAKKINIRILNYDFDNAKDFTYFMADAVTLYPLATPVWEPLPDYIQSQLNSLVMYRGDTSCVYVTRTDVVPDMTVNYVQDTNKVIQELRTAIIALGGAT